MLSLLPKQKLLSCFVEIHHYLQCWIIFQRCRHFSTQPQYNLLPVLLSELAQRTLLCHLQTR